jgi:hypothetical protein
MTGVEQERRNQRMLDVMFGCCSTSSTSLHSRALSDLVGAERVTFVSAGRVPQWYIDSARKSIFRRAMRSLLLSSACNEQQLLTSHKIETMDH